MRVVKDQDREKDFTKGCPRKYPLSFHKAHTIYFNNGYAVEILRHCHSVGGDKGLYEILCFDPKYRMVGTIQGNLSLLDVLHKLKQIRSLKKES
jgi:hypothetical protein